LIHVEYAYGLWTTATISFNGAIALPVGLLEHAQQVRVVHELGTDELVEAIARQGYFDVGLDERQVVLAQAYDLGDKWVAFELRVRVHRLHGEYEVVQWRTEAVHIAHNKGLELTREEFNRRLGLLEALIVVGQYGHERVFGQQAAFE
jgi:hypothetical protein